MRGQPVFVDEDVAGHVVLDQRGVFSAIPADGGQAATGFSDFDYAVRWLERRFTWAKLDEEQGHGTGGHSSR